jgi:hypothetical protein
MDGALGNFQPLGQLTGGGPAIHLEQEHDRNQAIGAHESKCIKEI